MQLTTSFSAANGEPVGLMSAPRLLSPYQAGTRLRNESRGADSSDPRARLRLLGCAGRALSLLLPPASAPGRCNARAPANLKTCQAAVVQPDQGTRYSPGQQANWNIDLLNENMQQRRDCSLA